MDEEARLAKMRHGTTELSRLRGPLGIGFSLLVAAWFCLLPVFHAVHLAFADHDHTSCLEHHRIEDVPRTNPALRAIPAAVAKLPQWTANRTDPAPQPHDPCAILGLTIAQGSMVSLRQSTTEAGVDDRPGLAPASRQEHLPGRPLLLSAPKTSPPLV